jgi:hypothetical protein
MMLYDAATSHSRSSDAVEDAPARTMVSRGSIENEYPVGSL